MSEEKKEKLLALLCLLTSIIAVCLTCFWYIGLILAVASVILGLYHNKRFSVSSRIVTAGLVIGFGYIGLVVLILLAFFVYYSMLSNW